MHDQVYMFHIICIGKTYFTCISNYCTHACDFGSIPIQNTEIRITVIQYDEPFSILSSIKHKKINKRRKLLPLPF